MDLKFVFSIGNGQYGLPVEVVDHTLPAVSPQLVPWMPSFHMGLFSYRGEIIPLLDLREFLDEPDAERGEAASILVLKSGTTRFATPVKTPQFVSVPDIEWPLHPQSSIYPALDQQVEVDGKTFTMINAERLQIQVQRALQEYFSEFASV